MSANAQAREKATSSPTRPFKPLRAGILQRKCACGTHTIAGGECESCQQEKASINLQRDATSAESVNEAPRVVNEVLRSPAQPLDAAPRSSFEPRFEHDFSRVRVHSDEASHSAIRLAAKLTGGGAVDAKDVGGITLRADVDAGVPPAKAPDAPPAKAPAAPACTYKITYANEQSKECGAGLRGAILHYDITEVRATGKGCPATLDGLRLTEKVTSDDGCHPQKPTLGEGCTVHADKAKPLEGRFKECEDNYEVCGDNQAFKFAGCTEILTQDLFIGGEFAERHTLKFEIFKRDSKPSGKATRT
jgi:hypothetical protein